jgi:hypothetical protein
LLTVQYWHLSEANCIPVNTVTACSPTQLHEAPSLLSSPSHQQQIDTNAMEKGSDSHLAVRIQALETRMDALDKWMCRDEEWKCQVEEKLRRLDL